MPHDRFPTTPDKPQPLPYSERDGYVADETINTTLVPVLRSDGSVDQGWMRIGTYRDQIVLQKDNMQKLASPETLQSATEHWDTVAMERPADMSVEYILRKLGGTANTAVEPEPERPVDKFSVEDRQLLNRFAFFAISKRDAQAHDEGALSGEYSREMGALLKAMSPEARSAARNVTIKMYGDENVAF